MSEETKETQQPENTHPEDNGAATGKTFTQDEVNKIVAERLSRERSKGQPSDADQKSTELDKKAQDLANREMMAEFKETLAARGYPKEFADVLKGSNIDELKTSLRIADQAFFSRHNFEEDDDMSGFSKVGTDKASADTVLRKIFSPKKRGK